MYISSHKIHSDYIAKANVFKERKKERKKEGKKERKREREESQQMQLHKWNYHNITRISVFSVKNTKHSEKCRSKHRYATHTQHTHTHTPNTTNNNTNIHTDTERGSHLFQVSHIAELYTYLQTNIRTCWHTYVNIQAYKWQSYPLK